MRVKFYAAVLLALFFVTAATAAETGKFFNVNMTVTEAEGVEPTQIKLRLPLGLLNAMKPQIEEALANVELPEHKTNLKDMWKDIRTAGPSRFVEVTNPEANVTVDTTVDNLIIIVDHKAEGQVQVKMPLSLGDLLFDGQQVDTQALIEELSALQGDLVTITGDKVNGRVWIE